MEDGSFRAAGIRGGERGGQLPLSVEAQLLAHYHLQQRGRGKGVEDRISVDGRRCVTLALLLLRCKV